MPDTTPAAYTIVPWVRRELATLITVQPTTNFASLPVTLRVNGALVNAPPVRLAGPGQISSLDARAVVRTDPRNGAMSFEPNYLAMVELALPDLPWMFTPSPPVNGRLQPWICLVVVPDTEGITLANLPGGMQAIHIDAPLEPKNELPDLATVDAWAHVQVTGASLSGTAINTALDGDVATTVSRLIAARKLEANKSYIAAIVPTYRAGLNAALGLPVDDHDLAPAWDATVSVPFVLPAYYVFRFHTAAGGDFASLAQKIKPPKDKLDAGTRTMDVSEPGFGAAGVPGATLGLEGALRAVDNQPTDWPVGAQAIYESQLRAALTPPAVPDPIVAPPTYGSTHSGSVLPPPAAPPIWLGELNLDPRNRAAASTGSQVVQNDQEALVASAWDQLGDIRKANQLLRQAQLARQVSQSLSRRHLEPLAGDGTWLQVTAPLHSRVRITLNGVTATLRGHIQSSRLPVGSLSSAMRRIARPAGPIGKQLKPGTPQIVDRLNLPAASSSTALQIAGPVQAPRGMIALDDVSADVQLKNMTVSVLGTAVGWQVQTAASLNPALAATPVRTAALDEAVLPTRATGPIVTGPANPAGPAELAPLVDWKSDPNLPDILSGLHANLPPPIAFPTDAAQLTLVATNFRTAAGSISTYLSAAPAAPPDAAPLGGQAALAPTRAQLLGQLNPADTIRARVGARIPLGAGPDPLQQMHIGPKYPQPMYAPLAEISPEWMLPGISQIPDDCATLLATNDRFIEAYMVGLNDEMSRELLWREFPTDPRATYFQNFWGAAATDISSIADFTPSGHLGDHLTAYLAQTNFVLLIRATLFQRYPNAVVSAIRAQWSGAVRTLTDDRKYPLFRGQIGADVTFFGFDVDDPKGSNDTSAERPGWYFVIEEHVTEPRVGLEPAKNTNTPPVWNDLSWDDVTLKGNYLDPATAPASPSREGVAWSQNSAAMGFILMRRPVRVALHAQALLGVDA